MKRVISWLVIIYLAGSFLAVPASAHAGKTDGNGGHYDHSTGTYHYHHGYPAHQHFDIDGDGVVDCPYDFDDQTSRTSGSSSGNSSGLASASSNSKAELKKWYQNGYDDGESKGYKEGYAAAEADVKQQVEEANAKIENEKKMAAKKAYLISLFVVVPAVAFFVGAYISDKKEKEVLEIKSLKDKEIRELKIQKDIEIQDVKAQKDKAFQEMNTQKSKEIRETKALLERERNRNTLLQANPKAILPEGIPSNVKLKLECTPVCGYVSKDRPYGDYTVYITPNGKKYHYSYNCCRATTPIHIFRVHEDLTACRNCVPARMQHNQKPDWYLALQKEVKPSQYAVQGAVNPACVPIHASEYDDAMDMVEIISERLGIPVIPMLEQLCFNAFKTSGKPEAEIRIEISKKRIEQRRKRLQINTIPQNVSSDDFSQNYQSSRNATLSQEIDEGQPQKYTLMTEVEERKVDSSFIKSIDYRDSQLFVTLTNGTYCYYNVPESVFKEFSNAPSKGKYFREHIVDKYPYY